MKGNVESMPNSLVQPLFDVPLDVVGDVHGEIEVLRSLIHQLGYDNAGKHPDGRRLVFLGDLTDRGPDIGIKNDKFPNEDKMNLHLVNLLKSSLSAEHLVHIDLRFESLNGQRVLVVKCRLSNLPVYLKDGKTELFYTRTGAATTELLSSQIQRYLKQRF